MLKVVYSIYDVQADMYDRPMMFDNDKIAIASVRRDIRDMFLKKQVTIDALRDRQLKSVGRFDTQSGTFEISDYDDCVTVRLSDFVGDLVVDDEV